MDSVLIPTLPLVPDSISRPWGHDGARPWERAESTVVWGREGGKVARRRRWRD